MVVGSADGAHLASDDVRLIARIADGDPDALRTLYDRYGRMVHSIAYRVTGDAHAAEECTQDAFMSVWRGAAGYDARRSRPSTWLYGIARNRAIDAARSRQRRPVPQADIPEVGAAPDTADVVADADAAVRVAEALARLSPDQLDVMQLTYFDGLSQSEIADTLGLPLGTVKSRLRLAMARMRGVVRDLGLEP